MKSLRYAHIDHIDHIDKFPLTGPVLAGRWVRGSSGEILETDKTFVHTHIGDVTGYYLVKFFTEIRWHGVETGGGFQLYNILLSLTIYLIQPSVLVVVLK